LRPANVLKPTVRSPPRSGWMRIRDGGGIQF
jgi:hypothetical protein